MMTEILKFKKSNCKNCHKCIRACPVKSIRFADSQAKVVSQECILCGQCILACPQNAKVVRNDLTQVFAALGQGRRIVASVAPSFISAFGVSGIAEFSALLRQLGFSDVRETAQGAYVVKTEYERIIAEHRQDIVISTCCHTVVSLVQKYYPDAIRFLAPVVSPMIASARMIKQEDPDAYVVFLGPCISKKDEMTHLPGTVDCVLTFDELELWFEQKGIAPIGTPHSAGEAETRISRFFPKTGGIIESMNTEGTGWQYLAVDGVHNCMDVLEELRAGSLQNCFIEMSACVGSCISGPVSRTCGRSLVRNHIRVNAFARPDPARRDDFTVTHPVPLARAIPAQSVRGVDPPEAAILEILAKMGKTRPEQELNCGSCGYPSCREKARAVYDGHADIAMCLPFLLEKAESFSTNIFEISPNAILVLDDSLTIQKLNASASHLFNFPTMDSGIGHMIFELMDPSDFQQVLESGNDLVDKHIELSEYGKFAELSIVRDAKQQSLFAILKDITVEHRRREQFKEYRQKTIEITDHVVEKQMRIVQEIASLLGETTAETKIALNQIKNAVETEEQS